MSHRIILGTHSDVLQTVVFDEAARTLRVASTLQLAEQPSWVHRHPYLENVIYSLSRQEDGGLVFVLKAEGEGLEVMGSRSSEGAGPNNVHCTPDGRGLVVVNYASGNVVLVPLDPKTGLFLPVPSHSLNLPYSTKTHPRQEASHPHHIVFLPDDAGILVPDLGSDLCWRLRWRWASEAGSDGAWEILDSVGGFPEGSGPRHSVLHPSGRALYTLSEMSSAMTVHSLPEHGLAFSSPIEPSVTLSILPDDYDSTLFHGASEIAYLPSLDPAHPDMILCTNRDCDDTRGDAIAVFLVDRDLQVTRGEPAFVFCGGKHLRGMGASGRWVAVAGRDAGGLLVVYERTADGRSLQEVARLAEGLQKPVDALWM